MKKLFSLTFFAMLLSFASFAIPGPITGSTSSCLGYMGYVADSTSTGGTWSSSNTLVATIDASGTVYGVSAGTTTITYTQGGSFVTELYTVYPAAPPPITGASSFCAGTNSTLFDAVSGGVWTSSNPYIATVDAATGVVYGVYPGYVDIYYSASGGTCYAITTDTITGTDPGFLIVYPNICMGATDTVIDSVTIAGTWSTSNPAIATINSAGVVYGVSTGTVIISYTIAGVCGPVSATQSVNIINTTTPGTISGTSTVNVGGTDYLYETETGGSWSTSSATATVDAVTGVVTGVSVGTAVITYTISGCGGIATTTYTVTIVPLDGISGNVNFGGPTYYGPVEIWLITYNPTTQDLEAIDSVSLYCNGSSVYYQFTGVATDSYRVKASVYDSAGITTGYIPTYHNSSFYWYTANVINHTSGGSDINEDINMAYGTVTAGPGFIGGNVSAGANKGTIVTVPSVGLHMNIFNSSNQLMQSEKTDASGNYSFSNLPLGTYYVFPDSLNYMTTAYTSITLNSAASSMTTAGFTQHTLSKTITPNTTGIGNVSNSASTVFAFPNPTNGKLNLQWQESVTEKGTVTLTDITGRDIYSAMINMTEGTGVKQIDLSGFVNGLYIITVKSGTINYNSKIQIQK